MVVHPKSPRGNQKELEKELVAEQPGFLMSFLGIALALLIGLTIKVTIAPEKVKTHLNHAVSKVHRDLSVRFESAAVSLSRGIFPDLAVVIKGVQIESKNECWLSPLGELNEIRLPLSWRHLFVGQIFIHEIVADEVNLSLRVPPENCQGQRSFAEIFENHAIEPNRMVAASNQKLAMETGFSNVRRPNPIDTVSIRKLVIHYLPVPFTSFRFDRIVAKLVNPDPREIQVRAHLNLGGETLAGDYASQAALELLYSEREKKNWQLTARGDWREGRYDFVSKFTPHDDKFSVKADLRHLPLSQILPVLKKYRLVEKDFDGRQLWVSGKFESNGESKKIKQTPILIENFSIEGDLGEIQTSKIEVHSIEPAKFSPFEMNIKGIDMKNLLQFLNRPHPSKAIGSMGTFNGTATLLAPEHLLLRGDYSGLEFIFSNKGKRQVQTISLLSGEIELKQKNWFVTIDRIRPMDGLFEGSIKMKADRDWRDLWLESRIQELNLSPAVQTLMTNGGSLGALSGNLKTHLKGGQIQELQGSLRWDRLILEGLFLEKPKAEITSRLGQFYVRASASSLDFDADAPAVEMFRPVFQESSSKWHIAQPEVQIRTNSLKDFEWSRFQGRLPQGLIRSRGGWTEAGLMSGDLRIGSSNGASFWKLSGTRNQPLFERTKEIQP